MKNKYNLNEILAKLFSGDNSMQWNQMYNVCRNYISASAKHNRRIRIQKKHWYELSECTLFDKLIVTIDKGKFIPSYITVFDRKTEMAYLREVFDPKI